MQDQTRPKANHSNVFQALSAAQAEFPAIKKERVAKVKSKRTGAEFEYRFANLADLVEQTKPILGRHGLLVTQPVEEVDSDGKLRHKLVTVLAHESGNGEIRSTVPLHFVGDPQEIGAQWSYMRRYAYEAILGIASGADDDDGANAAPMRETRTQRQERKQAERPPAIEESTLADWISHIESCGADELHGVWRGYAKRASAQGDKSAAQALFTAYQKNPNYKAPGAPSQQKRDPA
ncbi:MAG: ERF family protein [Burkholderiaceae bacterium]